MITCGAGNDTINSGAGVDSITSGDGADVFIFAKGYSGVGKGNRDIITDFDVDASGEIFDLSMIAAGKLNFISHQVFSATNQIRFDFDYFNAMTIVKLNLDNDVKTTEMEIELTGFKNLTADDFVLVKGG